MPHPHQLNHIELLETISNTLSRYISESNPYLLFNGLLKDLLKLTHSEYGFIGEVFHNADGTPYIQSYATTDIAWSADTRKLYQETAEKGMIFGKLNSLYGDVLKTAQPVISNAPAKDPRSGGLPKGHPPLNCFLGLPFYSDNQLQGVVGIANRQGGYNQALVEDLAPFLSTCSNLIRAYRNNVKRLKIEDELESYKLRLKSALNKKENTANTQAAVKTDNPVQLHRDFRFCLHTTSLFQGQKLVTLTVKEKVLLKNLAEQPNTIVSHQQLERLVWPDVVVGTSSLRALVLRLRKKAPGLPLKSVSKQGYMLETNTTDTCC
ncbi:MAG: GAF domain-containing protein [Motiliproteus sp.]